MQACENVIVTIQLKQEEIDMELPAFLSIKELQNKLDETIRVMAPRLAGEPGSLSLTYNGHLLDENHHLAFYGIWDGSRIGCSYRQEGSK